MTDEEIMNTLEQFLGNVKRYSPVVLGKTDREMMEPYIGMSDFSEEDIERLCMPHAVQPANEATWSDLCTVAEALLLMKDGEWFYSSIEGDYMIWAIHFFEKVACRMPLTENDWSVVANIRGMHENGEWITCDLHDAHDDVAAALERLPDVRTSDTIFDIVLC